VLTTLSKMFPGVSRLLILIDGTAYPTAPGNLKPQLEKAQISEDSVRAVYVRETAGLTIPVLAQHDIQKPMFLTCDDGTRSIGRHELQRLRRAIQSAHG
jgi:hypothetical protein